VTIRTATTADCQNLAAFLARAFIDEREYSDETTVQEIAESLEAGDVWLVLEEQDNDMIRLVGCVCAYRERLENNAGRIGQLAIESDRRGRGLGSELMRLAEERLRDAGYEQVSVGVLGFKAESLVPFYEGLGYIESGRTKTIIPPLKKLGEMIVMSKTFAYPDHDRT
jgi:predicted N-acetyltransferase YhbS